MQPLRAEPRNPCRTLVTGAAPRNLIIVGLALLVVAWLMASPPFAAPDEDAHYLRALTITNGHLVGPRAPNTLLGAQGHISRLGERWEDVNSRGVRVPAALSPPGPLCQNHQPNTSGSCEESSYTGTYQPLPYLLPAATLAVASSVHSASWLTRIASAAPAVGFFVLALFVLWDGTLLSVVGLLAALTPMVLFITSVLNPNGLELGATTALMACLIRLAREHGRAPTWIFAAAAVSGAVAILSWQLGPVFVVIELVLFVALVRWRELQELLRSRTKAVLAMTAALVSAGALYLVYAVAAGTPKVPFGLHHLGDLHAAADQLRTTLAQGIGTFGKLTVPLPATVRGLWIAVIALLLIAALAIGTARQRLALAFSCLIAVGFPIVFDAFIYRHTGFGLQARYLLAVWMTVPLLSSEVLRSRAGDRLAAAIPLNLTIVLLALLQLVAWWINARHSAGRPDSVWFVHGASWNPPLGWWPWIAAAVIGSCVIAAAALVAAVTNPVRASTHGQLPWKRARGN